MSNFFIVFCYIFFAYGITVFFTASIGPANIFLRLRLWADSVGDNFGMLFRCQTCFPANLGWIFSLFNWFCISRPISPFNIVLNGTNLWWLAAIMDCAFTAAVVRLIWNVDDFIDKSTPIFEEDLSASEREILND